MYFFTGCDGACRPCKREKPRLVSDLSLNDKLTAIDESKSLALRSLPSVVVAGFCGKPLVADYSVRSASTGLTSVAR